MKIIIDINTDNAAFGDNDGELQEIMDSVTNKIALWGDREGTLRDSNGNSVGNFTVTE